jgi:hypothetical protein
MEMLIASALAALMVVVGVAWFRLARVKDASPRADEPSAADDVLMI